MSYRTQSLLTRDTDILDRIIACAASVGVKNPTEWVWSVQWIWAAQPNWDDAYATAVASGNPSPGQDETVVTDAMILEAVTLAVSDYTPEIRISRKVRDPETRTTSPITKTK